MTKVSTDSLFAAIEARQDPKGWKSVLDAGTGKHSLKWLLSIADEKKIERIVAVTADEQYAASLKSELQLRPCDEIILGNWNDPEFLKDEKFHVVIADYLIGAIDGFAPYFQEDMLGVLSRLVEPLCGQLHVIGMEPIDILPKNTIFPDVQELILDVVRARDACILLAGHRCYREYPKEWLLSQLNKSGFAIECECDMRIVYNQQTVCRQINVARCKLPLFAHAGLANEMKQQLDDLESKVSKVFNNNRRFPIGFDYVITAVALVE